MPHLDIAQEHAADPLGFALSTVSPQIGPAAGSFVLAVYQHLRVPLRVAEAARYRIALINGCVVCQAFRAGDHLDAFIESSGGDAATSLVARGGEKPPEEFYAAVTHWRDSDIFSERERLAIEYAERFAENPRDLPYDPDFWGKVRAGFTDEELSDLTLAIGCWVAMGRFTHVLDLDGACVAGM